MRRFAKPTCPIRTDLFSRVLFALGAAQLQPIVQQEFSRFLLPQRGQKSNAPPLPKNFRRRGRSRHHIQPSRCPCRGAAIASERPAIRPESADSLPPKLLRSGK